MHYASLRAALALLFFTTVVAAQSRQAEVQRPSTPVDLDATEVRVDLIAIKFVERHQVRLMATGLESRTLEFPGVLEVLGKRRVERMFTRPVDALDREKIVLEARSGWRLADLNNYFFVHTAGEQDSEALLNALLADPAIETAYAEPIPVPTGDPAPPTPDFESRQTYMAAAPGGHGHWLTRGIDGAQGLGSQIVAQLEGAWILGHEDADDLVRANVIGTKNFGGYGSSATWYRHGTATFGIINASRNGWGVRGFAPLASGRVSSLANGAANMISLSTDAAKAGDVLTSSFAYVVSGKHAPLDYTQSNFDAVKRAAAKGICYTYSAGNTGADLATISGRYAANAPDSGGFIIGGTGAGNRRKAGGSNWGVKVVANGWYSSVTTLAYGNLFYPGNDLKQSYTRSFGGTSAAAPQVAGVIASMQGAAEHQNGAPLSVARVRALLKVHGTTMTSTQNIGLRPDLMKLMAAIGVLDGMRVANEASVGGRLDLELSMVVGRQWWMFASFGRSAADVGLNRKILLDLNTAFVFLTGTMRGSGSRLLQLNVPNDNALRDKSLFLQVFDYTLTDQHLTNSVEVYVK